MRFGLSDVRPVTQASGVPPSNPRASADQVESTRLLGYKTRGGSWAPIPLLQDLFLDSYTPLRVSWRGEWGPDP